MARWFWVGVLAMVVGMPAVVPGGGLPKPPTPKEAQQQIRLAKGLRLELVACEPNLTSPVFMTFAPDGKLWVVEMRDYPNGPQPGQPPEGRIRILEDKDGDGFFESSSIFADKLLFANGLFLWKDGAIVTRAPNIVFLRDTDGDGKADKEEILFEGFAAQNPQLRVSHPIMGLDGWIYCANGLRGGAVIRHGDKNAKPVSLSGMDFRFDPVTLEYEAISGLGQFGNTFDDWGNRFVCDNRHHLRHIVLENRYLKRNPFLAAPAVVEDISILDDGPLSSGGKIYPISKNWTTSSLHVGRFTAACGVHIYRGNLLPEKYRGAAFTCDPTGNLVHAETMKMHGGSFQSTPMFDKVEFLASPNDWFRPVSLCTGPEGALYVVDMNRAVIEHPEFMPEELRKRPDLILGKETGRIWRIVPDDYRPKEMFASLAKAPVGKLLGALGHANVWQRLTAQRLLVEMATSLAMKEGLRNLVDSNPRPETAVQALWLLERCGELTDKDLAKSLQDPSARVREQAVKLVDKRLAKSKQLGERLLALSKDEDSHVRFHVALALGSWDDRYAMVGLASIVLSSADKWTRLAVTSATPEKAGSLFFVVDDDRGKLTVAEHAALVRDLCLLIGARKDNAEISQALRLLANTNDFWTASWPLAAVNGLAEGLSRRGDRLENWAKKKAEYETFFVTVLNGAAKKALDAKETITLRLAAINLLAQAPWNLAQVMSPLLSDEPLQEIRVAVVRTFASQADAAVPAVLMKGWRSYTPAVRREVTEAMMRNATRIEFLLDEIQAKNVRPADLDSLRVRQLINHSQVKIRERAKVLLAAALPGDRREALAKYQGALTLKGDALKGREIFKKNCATCHKVGDIGIDVGPDIADTRTKTHAALLTDILNPNLAIDNNYVNYLVTTKSGKSLTGILQTETASSITLKRAEGQIDVVLRSDIDELQSTGVSLMPDGLEKNITVPEMADLLSFLKNWRYMDGAVPFKE